MAKYSKRSLFAGIIGAALLILSYVSQQPIKKFCFVTGMIFMILSIIFQIKDKSPF